MPLGNIIILDSEIPERMHFTSHVIADRDITDPSTGGPGIRKVLEFSVDKLNGQPANAKFSTMSENLYAQLEAYLPNGIYRGYEFIITKRGSGYRTKYKVDKVLLAAV